MAGTHFTIDDMLDLQRDFTDLKLVHIEEAPDCDGELCGARAICGPGTPVRPHQHVVISRTHRDARQYRFYLTNASR